MAWLVDLDGVVWRSGDLIPGAPEAIGRLRAAGERVVFLTNNSATTRDQYVERLEHAGIPTEPDDVMTSALAAATLLRAGETALVCAGEGVEVALRERGVHTVREGGADAVVVGWHQDFDYGRLTAASRAVWGGARLVATNDDATYPARDGLLPGGGSILAAIVCATGATPEIAGKPYEPIARMLRERVPDAEIMVGDRPDTDGRLARRLGLKFALVLTGVTSEDDLPVDPAPDVVTADLATLVAQEYGE